MQNFVSVVFAAGMLCSAFAMNVKSSTIGQEFVFGIYNMLGDCCHNNASIVALVITNTSPTRTLVRIQIPFLNNDTSFYIPTAASDTYLIDPSIQRNNTFKDSRGIKITSDQDISVLVTDYIDSYNILPVTEIGNNYKISSYRGDEILIAASSNDTTVTLKNGSSVIQSVVLNEFEILQYLCNQCDLTGKGIVSNKNVFIVSGASEGNSDHIELIVSEMFPVSAWSNRYIIPPVIPRTMSIIKIVLNSSDDVTLTNRTGMFTLKELTEYRFPGNETIVATAKHPFSLTQFVVNSTDGDPFMVVVPGVDQYINDYTFTVPSGYYGVKYYAAIIIPASGISGLVLDGRSIQSYNTTKNTVPPPFNGYTVLTFPMNGGFHHFYHPIQSIKYGVFIYGHGIYKEAFINGFYAGYYFKAGSSSVPARKMCYSCEDLSHIDLCDTVKLCNDNEVCYVERYTDGGQIKYKSGCSPQNTCESQRQDSTYSSSICFECCDGDFCNNKGCGENGIPDRGNRGPICFECHHVSSPDECVNITPCDFNQVCRIEEYKWFDHSHFKLGCGHGLCDPVSKRSNVLKRSTAVCQSCCTVDYCNRNCTTTSQSHPSAVIVG